MFFTPKRRSHSAFSTYNMKKGIRCKYIPNTKALVTVVIEKKIKKRSQKSLDFATSSQRDKNNNTNKRI